MWSSKSVITLTLITAVVAVIVSSFIRNKVNKYIEASAIKISQTNYAPAKNENFMASALSKIESNKNENFERPQDVAQVIPQTSNVVQPVQEKKEVPPPPLGSGVRWTPI